MTPHSDRLQELAHVVDRAAEIALHARQDLQMDLKDISIVTNADRAVETYLREALIQSWPGTSFWGEDSAGQHQQRGLLADSGANRRHLQFRVRLAALGNQRGPDRGDEESSCAERFRLPDLESGTSRN